MNKERKMKMRGIVDRFEGDIVVIEIDGIMMDIPHALVEPSIKAGDSVVLVDGKWVKDEIETKSRTKKIGKLMESVWED